MNDVGDLGPVTLLPVACPRCGEQVGQVEARTSTDFYLSADRRQDRGHVSIDIKVRRHVTAEERREAEEKARRSPRTAVAQRDWQYASSSETFDHVCATITRTAATS